MELLPLDQNYLGQCAELFITVFNDEPWRENWSSIAVLTRLQEIYNTPGFYGVVAAQDGKLLGFAMGYIEQWDKEKVFYLKEMCVKTQLQGRGIGTTILETLEDELSQMGVNKVYLLTARNSSAEAFYNKRGFYVSQKMIMMGKYLKSS
jgi:N-acetylglutamate synthase-like GNAT family acetyltransferase